MGNSFVRSLAWAIGLGAVAALASAAGGTASEARRLGNDLFVAGRTATVDQPVAGDLVVAGGTVDVDASVAGDAVAAGGKVRLGQDVGQSVYAAGGQVTINGKVGRNVRVAGGQVALGPQSVVAGGVSVAGGRLRLGGTIKGYLQAAGGDIVIDGPVDGDVIAAGGELELGPRARIGGTLRYGGGGEIRQDPAAQVAGGIVRIEPRPGRADERDRMAERHGRRVGFGVASGIWMLGSIVLAGVLLALLPRFSALVSQALRERPGTSLLLGFALLVCVPVAAVLLFVTLIGLPLGLFVLALYAALLPVAWASAGIGLGDWAVQRWRPQSVARWPLRMAFAAAMLIGLSLVGWIPWLGPIVCFVALLAGLGALTWQLRRTLDGAAA